MSAIPKLLQGLRSILHQRGLGYRDLANRLKVSESTVKRIFSRGSVSVVRLEEICQLVDIEFSDLARACAAAQTSKDLLSQEQERALAADPVLLAVLHLLMSEWSPDQIRSTYEFDKAEIVSILARLDRLGLITLKPNNLVKVRVSPRMSWGQQKGVRTRYERMVREEFLDSRFEGADQLLCFEVRELTHGSIAVMLNKIQRVADDIQEMADRDATQPSTSKVSVGCLLSARPWVFSVLAALKRRAPAA